VSPPIAARTSGKRLTELESLRGFAAVYVFLHHADLAPNAGAGRLLYFGQEAVILFFLLSGFVIFYSTSSPRAGRIGVGTYLLHRARRIFPLMLIALAVAYVSACLVEGALADPQWINLLLNLFMLQDLAALKPSVWADVYQGNSPLWSLSYEWWFYMLFIPLGLVSRHDAKTRLQQVALLSVSGFALYWLYPNPIALFASYFVIWWTGVEMAREYREHSTVSFARQKTLIALLAACTFLWMLPSVSAALEGESLRIGVYPALVARHFAAALSIVLLGFLWRRLRLIGFRQTFGPFHVLAPISYSVYLLHVPVLHALSSVGIENPIPRALLAAAILLPACYLLEVRLQRAINRWTESMAGRYRMIARPGKEA
jgi:peptidoglycan/LPS O-acetylase OafA/YrhL